MEKGEAQCLAEMVFSVELYLYRLFMLFCVLFLLKTMFLPVYLLLAQLRDRSITVRLEYPLPGAGPSEAVGRRRVQTTSLDSVFG